MRIKLLYRHGEVWPWSMGKGFENALKELGHDIDVFISEKDSGHQVNQYEALYKFLEEPCDLFLAMGGGDKYRAFHYNEKIREYVRSMKVPRLAYFMESMKTRTITKMRYESTVSLWSHILTCDETELEGIKHLGCKNVEYAPGWVDEKVFYPMDIPVKHEFQFIGYVHKHRLLYVEHFAKHIGMRVGNYGTVEQYAEGINETKVVIGIPSVFQGLAQRVSETLACGKVLLHKVLPEELELSRQVFKDKEHIVFYKTMEEAVELAKYYASHDSEREKIEKSARAEILAKHTILQRAREFIYYAHA